VLEPWSGRAVENCKGAERRREAHATPARSKALKGEPHGRLRHATKAAKPGLARKPLRGCENLRAEPRRTVDVPSHMGLARGMPSKGRRTSWESAPIREGRPAGRT
jgi:hypothetical protein